ncbi:MAG: hypothetical protein DI568_11810 [Sphingomonas sp.]|nr:MAG: hypothetical protein DI568_11810 [Sphingomonas sp.]
MAELAGRLSERVRFEGRDEVRGAAAERGGGWHIRFERWAKVELLSRFEGVTPRADTRQSARRWRLELRDGVRPTLDMRIRWRGELMLPTAIETDPAMPGRIILWAEDWSD